MSGKRAISAANRSAVIMWGREPQGALASLTPVAVTDGLIPKRSLKSPSIVSSRPVASVKAAVISDL